MAYRIVARAVLAGMLLTALVAPAVGAHNAGCVPTGTGEYVFVGSNREGPIVPLANPMSSWDPAIGNYRLDLQPHNSGDQYGARHAADVGQSAVERPAPSRCTPPPPRDAFAP